MLLALARGAVSVELGGPGFDPRPEDRGWLERPAATFVTIRLAGRLHGCIGSILPRRSLLDDVRANAQAAAFADPRSRRLHSNELADARFEVSELTPTQPLPCTSLDQAMARVRPGIDGVLVSTAVHRGVFLPQVWEQLPAPEDFFDALWRKAGMRPGVWSPDLRLDTFQVEKYAEGLLPIGATDGFA